MKTPRTRRALASAAVLALLGLGSAACSAGVDDSSGSSGSSGSAPAGAPSERPTGGAALTSADNSLDSLAADSSFAVSGAATARRDPDQTATRDPSLIKTGNVALRSDDVADARFRVQKVVDTYGGEVSERNTEVGKDGAEARARMVIRVPAADFDAALGDLEGIGDLLSSTGSAEDVTTQVIDTGVRVRLQRRSIERISVLLDRATSIRDIVDIERELSRREADLGSLEKRQAYLADQTSMGTITVSIELPPAATKEPAPAPKKDDKGFFSGLGNGWDAFGAATVTVLTGLGTVLPFAVLLLVLAFPGRLLLRRLSTRTTIRAGTTARTP